MAGGGRRGAADEVEGGGELAQQSSARSWQKSLGNNTLTKIGKSQKCIQKYHDNLSSVLTRPSLIGLSNPEWTQYTHQKSPLKGF
jgi:hypothetical protein